MSENDQDQETGTVETGQENNSGGGHPAWQEILDQIPDELHHLVTPTLEKWDKGVQEKIQSLHSQFDPYKDVVSDYDPEAVATAIAIAEQIQANPQEVITRIADAYGISIAEATQAVTGGQGAVDNEVDLDDEDLPPALKAQMEATQAQLAEIQAFQEAERQAQEDAELEAMLTEYLDGLRQKHGDFDEDYVVALMGNGVDGEEAVTRYKSIAAPQAPQNPVLNPAPAVLGSGGSVPSGGIDVTKLGKAETEDLIIQALRNANQEG
jgi:hypothetical protein